MPRLGIVGTRPRPVGFDVPDRKAGRASDRAGLAVVELDGQSVLGHVDGEDHPGVGPSDRDSLAGHSEASGRGDSTLHACGLGRGAWGRAGRAYPTDPGQPLDRDRVRAGTQQLAGIGVEEHQRRRFDPERDGASGQDLRREDLLAGQGHDAGPTDHPVDLERLAAVHGRHRRGSARACTLPQQSGQVRGAQVGPDGLDPDLAGEQVDQVAVGPEPQRLPGPCRPCPELLARHPQIP